MESLEQLRRQLDTADDLGGIVRTMKALAAVSIRQYEAAVRSLADYARTVELGLHVVLRDLPVPEPAPVYKPAPAIGGIVFGSDHGLCGRFNEEIVQHALKRLAERSAGDELRLLAIGERTRSLLEQTGQPVEQTLFVPGSAERITSTVRQVLLKVEAWQHQESVARVYVFHQRPTGAGERHRPAGARLLPVSLSRFHRLEVAHWPGRTLPTFSMERTQLFSALLRQHFFATVFRACAESLAAENGSRLAAMHAADKNLAERHTELLGALRRTRQDAITNELLDVVAGYDAQRQESNSRAG